MGSFERTLEELDLGAYFLQTLVDENGQHLPGAHECPFFSKRGINKDLKFAPFVKSRSVITKTGQQRFSLDVSVSIMKIYRVTHESVAKMHLKGKPGPS